MRDLQLIRVLRALQIANLGITGTTNIKMLNAVICHPKESKSLKAMFFLTKKLSHVACRIESQQSSF